MWEFGEFDRETFETWCPVPISAKRKHVLDSSYTPNCFESQFVCYRLLNGIKIVTCMSPTIIDKDLAIDLVIYLSIGPPMSNLIWSCPRKSHLFFDHVVLFGNLLWPYLYSSIFSQGDCTHSFSTYKTCFYTSLICLVCSKISGHVHLSSPRSWFYPSNA